jgi:tRNA threonylcarbamoyl adenosine modification protein (Sua5/YciO/YrdC/YwlC family)
VSYEQAVRALVRGEIVGVPTDTVYGLAIDPFNERAVARLFELKGRPAGKPIGLLVASVEQADTVAEIKDTARELAERYWPGALTLIVRPRVVLSTWVGDEQSRTVGVRVPDHPTTIGLLNETGPLAVTSANVSNGAETYNHVEAKAVLGDRVAFYVEGTCPAGVASTVVDTTSDEIVVLREGAVHLGG